MAKFTVLLQSQPERYYRKTDRKTADALKTCVEKLHGYKDLYRYRLGGLRVVYEISLVTRTVGVVAILPRGDVYKRIWGKWATRRNCNN